MDKKSLSERDICTKFITPALEQAGWDIVTQVREEFPLTKGRIIVRGKLHTRAQNKRADYVLFHKPNMPIAVIEAKDNKHTVSFGLQQAMTYAQMLDVPFAYSSNGDAFYEHDFLTGQPKQRIHRHAAHCWPQRLHCWLPLSCCPSHCRRWPLPRWPCCWRLQHCQQPMPHWKLPKLHARLPLPRCREWMQHQPPHWSHSGLPKPQIHWQ